MGPHKHTAFAAEDVAAAEDAAAPAPPPSWAQKLACLSAGLLLALLLMAVLQIAQVQPSGLQHVQVGAVPTLQHVQSATPASVEAALTSHALVVASTPGARRRLLDVASPQTASSRHGRQRRPQGAAVAGAAGKTSAELLEADVLAAGGRVLGEDAVPCSFSFHTGEQTALTVTSDTSSNYQTPMSPLYNLLEWMYGVVLSYDADIQYCYVTPFAMDKPTAQVWPRFWGVAAGEFTVDDLSQRFAESKMATVFVDNALSLPTSVDKVKEATRALGEGITRENASPTLWYLRRPRVLDSQMACHPRMVRVLRQKYCAARAFRPVPVSLYDDATAPASPSSSLMRGLPVLPPPQQHPIHVAVQLSSDVGPDVASAAGSEMGNYLPRSMDEYVQAMALVIAQVLVALRRHTTAQVHVHLFADPPLEQSDVRNALWRLESDATLHALIASDASSNPLNEGVSLQTHYFLNALHSFHHLVMSDVLIAGWSATSLMAVTLHEGGASLVPALPQKKEIGGDQPVHFDLPLCGPWMESYRLRPSTPQQVEAQRVKIERWLNAEGVEVPAAPTAGTAAAADAVADAKAPALTPSRMELPSRRLARRRSAEALVLSTAFSEPLVRPPLFRPNALLMRHCQAIPEPKHQPRPAITQQEIEEDASAEKLDEK